MSKLQRFIDFVNERLAAAAVEIFGQYEKTLSECQEEICRSKDKMAELQRMMNYQPEIKLHRTDVQQLSLPELPQIKEEQELWTSQGGEQLQVPPLYQSPTVENRERDSEQIKIEYAKEDYGAPGPYSDSQPTSVTPDCPTAQSLEEEKDERGEPLPQLTTCSLKPQSTRGLKSPSKSGLRSKTIPSPWTRPISSSHSGSDTEDVSSGEAKSKTAEKPYQCKECGKAYSLQKTLTRHRRIHTGDKPYQCEECDEAFSKQRYLGSHRIIHTGDKPYQCEDCGRAFSRLYHLGRHRRIHTGEKPYQCEECNKTFRDQGTLVKHRQIHTREKPYQCEECNKTFREQGSLVIHRRIHTGEKPYQCEECDRAFSLQNKLARHRRIHTGNKPYQRCS